MKFSIWSVLVPILFLYARIVYWFDRVVCFFKGHSLIDCPRPGEVLCLRCGMVKAIPAPEPAQVPQTVSEDPTCSEECSALDPVDPPSEGGKPPAKRKKGTGQKRKPGRPRKGSK